MIRNTATAVLALQPNDQVRGRDSLRPLDDSQPPSVFHHIVRANAVRIYRNVVSVNAIFGPSLKQKHSCAPL